METISNQNREIIGRAYKQLRCEIYSIFRQASISEEACEDLVQDVFIKIMGLDIIIAEQLKGLAIRIAYQKRTDYFRHRAYINKMMSNGGWEMEKTYTNSEAEVNDILQAEMKVLHCLSELDCKTYMLSRFEEKTAEEIALTLNISKRAVDSRLYRARIQVRDRIRRVMGL